jgi:hypothetical protein
VKGKKGKLDTGDFQPFGVGLFHGVVFVADQDRAVGRGALQVLNGLAGVSVFCRCEGDFRGVHGGSFNSRLFAKNMFRQTGGQEIHDRFRSGVLPGGSAA